jgi:hypothetical protein
MIVDCAGAAVRERIEREAVGSRVASDRQQSEKRSARLLDRLLRFLRRLRRGLSLLGRLRTVLLGEALDPTLGVNQLLPSGEERMALRADFEVEILLGRPGFPRRAAGAVDGHLFVLGMDVLFHDRLRSPDPGGAPLRMGPYRPLSG